jgi:outer membrane receptor protein involved in Fe transport
MRVRWLNAGNIATYGYDYKGNSTDGYNVPGVSSKVDQPYEPMFAAAYVQNKFEFNDLILNVGLRYEYMDPKMLMVDPTLNTQTGQYDYQDVPVDQNLNIIPEDDFTRSKPFSFLLPRISFSFPVSDKTVFYTQYGKYVQMPSLNQLYGSENGISNSVNPLTRSFTGGSLGFMARPERTTLFEMGIRQVVTQNLAFTLTGFYKDTKEQLQLRRVYNSIGNPIFTSYQNTDFGTVKGVELTLELRRTERLQARVNYTLSDAVGTGASSASNAVAVSDEIKARFPNFVATQPFNQAHKGSIILDYRFAKGDGGPVLEGFGVNLLMTFNSGHPYTKIQEPLNLGQASPWNIGVNALRDARFRNPVEPVNSSTTPWVFNMDLNISKMIYLGALNVEIYANVLNLLNTKQIVDVYPNTGTPYDDGWLKSPFAQPYKAIPDYEAFYRAINLENRWGVMTYRNDVFGAPRQIRVGARIEM